MRVFKTYIFARFAREENMRDDTLANAIRDAERGLIAAQLGGGLIKLGSPALAAVKAAATAR
jgi:hypothetical protein